MPRRRRHALAARAGVGRDEDEPELGAGGAILAFFGDVGVGAGEARQIPDDRQLRATFRLAAAGRSRKSCRCRSRCEACLHDQLPAAVRLVFADDFQLIGAAIRARAPKMSSSERQIERPGSPSITCCRKLGPLARPPQFAPCGRRDSAAARRPARLAARDRARDADELGAHLVAGQPHLRIAVPARVDELEMRRERRVGQRLAPARGRRTWHIRAPTGRRASAASCRSTRASRPGRSAR